MLNLSSFENYLNERESAKNTIETYKIGIKKYFALYDELNIENVRLYKKYLLENFKAKTTNIRLCGLYAYAEYLGINLPKIKRVKIYKKITIENVISEEEFERLLSGLKADNNMRGYWIINFMGKTGARANEFVRFSKKCLESGYEELFTKGKVRRIYIPRGLISESKEYFEKNISGDLLFPSRYKKQITTRGIDGCLKSYAKKYGIRQEVMHCHSFRHFFAKQFLKKGGDLTLLSNLLGHESIETTAIYTRLSADEMAQELERIF
jgi:site-specific recombinase XerD